MVRRIWFVLALAVASGWIALDRTSLASSHCFADDDNGISLPSFQDNQDKQEKEGEGSRPVDFTSVDKVELKGRFFAGAKGKESPVVLMLHALGENSNNKEWQGLAKKFQEKGFAVLTFDFRGHGDSTVVQPGIPSPKPQLQVKGFWDETLNQSGVKGFANNRPRPTEIKYEQFNLAYYTVLANDIAAAKAFLDESECNSSALVLVGARDGATIGSVWLNSEWHRFKYMPAAPGFPQGGLDRANPEGQAVIGAAWLSLSPNLGFSKNALNLTSILDWPAKQFKTPMLFVYSKGDEKAANLAKNCEKFIVGKDAKKFPNTLAVAVDGAEKLAGKDLLLDSLGTSSKILEFAEAVMPRNGIMKQRIRTPDEISMWEWYINSSRTTTAVARKSGAKLPEFSGYQTFAR